MEFTISTNSLKKEAVLLNGIAEKKAGVAALSSVLIESTPTGVRLTATDLDTTIQSDIKATVTKAGNICVPAKKLCDIIKSLDTGDMKFKKDANEWVRVSCNKSKFRMAGIAREQFPATPEVESDEVVLDGETIKEMIKHTCFAVTQEEGRFALSGAKLMVANGTATMVATDGHRIALMEEHIDDREVALNVLIPKRALVEVAKFAESEVTVTDSDNHIKFKSGDRVLITRKLAMNFPNYEQAIPKDNDIIVAFDAEELIKGLKRVALMADENSRAIKFELQEGKLILTSGAAGEGESEEVIECEVENLPDDGFVINLNWHYLIDYLASCTTPVFMFKTANSAVQVTDGSSKYVVMPLRAG